jgi:hypothetical protein
MLADVHESPGGGVVGSGGVPVGDPGAVGSVNGPVPTAFLAATRNRYVVPFTRPVTAAVVPEMLIGMLAA